MTTFPFRDVVLVADLFDESVDADLSRRRDLESTHRNTLDKIANAIHALGLTVHHYESPRALADRAASHMGDVVLSIYGGAGSRNRMALVPAICETFGLAFVGPDAFGRVLAQDKEVSKMLASEAGLHVAKHRIVRSTADLKFVSDFPRPCVAKPLREGSSIGIGPRSLVDQSSSGDIVAELLAEFGQPVMVEEFLSGREVNWCFLQRPDGHVRSVFTELIWGTDERHFDRNLFDAFHKLSTDVETSARNIDAELTKAHAAGMYRLLALIGHMGYGRIDGKLANGQFFFLEITPDAWLGPTGSLVAGFVSLGLSFSDVMAAILLSATPAPQGQSSND